MSEETVVETDGITLEVFDRGAHPVSIVDPEVTIQRRGAITMNRAAAAALAYPEAIQLMYSESERIIGLRAAEPGAPRTFKLTPQGAGPTYYATSGKSFMNRYAIPHEVATRYKARTSGDGEILLVDLKEGGVQVFSSRSKTHEQGE
jgi:hypothetical protein